MYKIDNKELFERVMNKKEVFLLYKIQDNIAYLVNDNINEIFYIDISKGNDKSNIAMWYKILQRLPIKKDIALILGVSNAYMNYYYTQYMVSKNEQ